MPAVMRACKCQYLATGGGIFCYRIMKAPALSDQELLLISAAVMNLDTVQSVKSVF